MALFSLKGGCKKSGYNRDSSKKCKKYFLVIFFRLLFLKLLFLKLLRENILRVRGIYGLIKRSRLYLALEGMTF